MKEWGGRIGGMLNKYRIPVRPEDNPAVENDFDSLARTVDRESLSAGILAAFRSDRTPDFGPLVRGLFQRAGGEEKAGILEVLFRALGSDEARSLADRVAPALAGLAGRPDLRVSPEEAQQVEPGAVERFAADAASEEPGLVDRLSTFVADNPDLAKSLGGGALTTILSHIADRRSRG